MTAPKTCRKIEQPRSTSASGHLFSSRDDLLRTVLLSKLDLQRKSHLSSQTLDSPDCSQYLEDYRSYLEDKDRDEIANAEPGNNKRRNGAEKQSKSQGNSGKFRSLNVANDSHSQRLTGSPLLYRDSEVRHSSIGGSIVGESRWQFINNLEIGVAGSLPSLSRHGINGQTPDGDAARSERRFLPKSVSNPQSLDGRSRLPSFGIASVELKSGRKDEVLKRKLEEAAVQTDPELAVNDVQDNCAQTDDVRDDLSYSGSDVSIEEYKDVISYQDDDRNDVRSDTKEDYREDEDFSHDEDGNQSEAGSFYSFDENTARSRRSETNQYSYPGLLEKATNSELDSGIGNTISQDLSSFWVGMTKSGQKRPAVDSNESRLRTQHLFELKDFGQQTVDTQSTQTPLRFRVGIRRPQLQVLGAVSPEDWLLTDSGQEGRVCLEPWPMLGLKEEDQQEDKRTVGRDFATQTFGQVTSVVRVSNETQTNSEEWQKPDKSADQEKQKEVDSDLYLTTQQQQQQQQQQHYHLHTSRPVEFRTKNDGTVRKNGRKDEWEDAEDRSPHARIHSDQCDDDLTDEIIHVFKDTRKLIAEARAGKQPEVELLSGKRQLLEIMLREVKSLKSRVGREEDAAGDMRISMKEGKRGKSREPTKLTESDSAIESDKADEDEERRRRMELLHRSPHGRNDRSRRNNNGRRHSERNTSNNRARGGERRHHSNFEEDSRYRHWIDGSKRIERSSSFTQSALPYPPPVTLQESISKYQRGASSSHDPRIIWSRPVQGPPPVAQNPSSSFWPSQQPNNSVVNPYPGQLPHSSVVPAPLPARAAPSVYWRHPMPHYQSLGINHRLPNSDRPPLWTGTSQIGLGGAFRPIIQTTSTVQKPGFVFFPATPAGTVVYPGPGHPHLPGQGHPPVLMPQQGSLSYVPIQSGLIPRTQPSVFLPVQGLSAAVRPTQGQGHPVGPSQQVNESLRDSQGPSQTNNQRHRSGLSRRWRASAFEFEQSIKQAALEAEQIKELSNRLLRQSASPVAA